MEKWKISKIFVAKNEILYTINLLYVSSYRIL